MIAQNYNRSTNVAMEHNGKVLLSGGASRNYGSTLAQKFNSSPIAEFGTSAPLAAIQCYRQAR